ncbi:MAG TPA: c-type cytochrome [Arcobacter sp.]|nr:c-type cytochrome [Arcobacter sp.]
MLKKSLLLLSFSSLIVANTTMCYKQNWTNPATIETVKLNGGKCLNSKSLQDMENEGWVVSDIKINPTSNNTGMDYLYILKKDTYSTKKIIPNQSFESLAYSNTTINQSPNDTMIEYKKKQESKLMATKGKKLYRRDCLSCHGENAEIRAYGVSNALNTLTYDEFEVAIRDYDLDEKDNGFAIIMKPIATSLSVPEIKAIHKYLETLK